jgi:hypothetical protein
MSSEKIFTEVNLILFALSLFYPFLLKTAQRGALRAVATEQDDEVLMGLNTLPKVLLNAKFDDIKMGQKSEALAYLKSDKMDTFRAWKQSTAVLETTDIVAVDMPGLLFIARDTNAPRGAEINYSYQTMGRALLKRIVLMIEKLRGKSNGKLQVWCLNNDIQSQVFYGKSVVQMIRRSKARGAPMPLPNRSNATKKAYRGAETFISCVTSQLGRDSLGHQVPLSYLMFYTLCDFANLNHFLTSVLYPLCYCDSGHGSFSYFSRQTKERVSAI